MTRTQKQILISTGIILAVHLAMKYILRLIAPFFIAWLLVQLINPLANRIHKRLPLKKEWITLLLLGTFLSVVGTGLYFLAATLFKQLQSILANIDSYRDTFAHTLDGWSLIIEQRFNIPMEDTMQFLSENLSELTQKITVSVVPGLFSNSLAWIRYFLKFIASLMLIFVAVTMLMRDYDDICKKLSGYSFYRHFSRISARIFSLGGAWLKSQLLILSIVITICVIGLWIIRNPYALLLGILIGLLDALPFLGTSIVFLPWALISCLQKDFFHAAAYATIFLIASSTREFLEPRLLGDRLGIYPILIALVVYVGLVLYGPTGFFLGPLSLFIILEILQEFPVTNK